MNLIPFAGAVLSFVILLSYWMETYLAGRAKNSTYQPKEISVNPSKVNLRVNFFYRYSPSFLFLSLTILQLHIYGELSQKIDSNSIFFGIHIPCLLLLGPFSYLFFEEISGGEVHKINQFHFLPSFLSVFYIFLFRVIEYFPLSSFGPILFYHYFSEINLVLLGIGVLSILCYSLFFMVRMLVWKMNSETVFEFSFLPFFFLFLYSIFVIILFVLAQLFYMKMFLFACFSLTSLLGFLIILKINHKELIPNFRTETRFARYKESRVKGIDVLFVLRRLDDLMNINKLYLNEKLTLASLAKELDLNTHQLSEILNTRLDQTFRNYINQFRLQEAARLLKERKDMAIINVIYSSGFNSKSAFHKLFQNRYGVSPQSYRSE
ncbi:AraC family transcriptional regulator [Leptospira brenneri]|uniref:AraC family transcriptional regulator n=1 Tax=Leptospira brenneri TaxID=2023182 RepID=A0A2M9XYZ6_9LEPT|nr:helix-turn-helix domain-containing protein [Leptospira brenneri]PJZ44537.1 AraC family transcriptional regulator [Leptospira brenneri]TGK95541.1 AraC family transcriptional regulator [Leptospira brenneri]